ncbi:MAG TPA: hypothetical protein VKF62_00820, partial [Planctomycetota bacterium]|nr:hypothetical protein [Planctomycetota bacterium]
IRFELDGKGGVSIGSVKGIDAGGRTARGRLRFDGTHLDLVLPDEFLAEAAFPLLLDPLLGALLADLAGGGDDVDPDIAADAPSSTTYLVVWEHRLSATDIDIRGQRFSMGGTAVGGMVSIATGTEPSVNPSVAYSSGRFLVVWQEGPTIFGPWDILGTSVDAATGAVSAETTISADPESEVDPDVGATPSLNDTAFVTWSAVGSGIRGRGVQVASPPGLLGDIADLSTVADDGKPAISQVPADSDGWLVVWQRFFFGAPGDNDLRARAVALDAAGDPVLSPLTTVLTTIGPDEEDPDCSRSNLDVHSFLIVYEREAVAGSGDNDIRCKSATVTSVAGVPALTIGASQITLEADPDDDEVNPAVASLGPKYVVVWSDEATALDYDLWMLGVNPVTCAVCEAETPVDTSPNHDGSPAVAFGTGDEGMIVWQSSGMGSPFAGDIKGQRVEAIGTGGPVADIGGGCGGGGTAGVNGPVAVGNSTFQFTLAGADAGAAGGILVVGSFLLNFNCASCTLKPNFGFTPFVAVGGGAAQFPLPIPCAAELVGATFYAQWAVLPASASPCALAPDLALSDAVSVTIGL